MEVPIFHWQNQALTVPKRLCGFPRFFFYPEKQNAAKTVLSVVPTLRILSSFEFPMGRGARRALGETRVGLLGAQCHSLRYNSVSVCDHATISLTKMSNGWYLGIVYVHVGREMNVQRGGGGGLTFPPTPCCALVAYHRLSARPTVRLSIRSPDRPTICPPA